MLKALTIEKIAYEYGYQPSFIREACNRSPEYHPLPHIKRGAARPVAYIQRDTFWKWLKEEELLQVGLPLPDEEAQASLQDTLREIWREWDAQESESVA